MTGEEAFKYVNGNVTCVRQHSHNGMYLSARPSACPVESSVDRIV